MVMMVVVVVVPFCTVKIGINRAGALNMTTRARIFI
jgi:hypothetical protein